ncbi:MULTISPECIES: HlyD family efflux transporter periplasmic adaptor subunit [unclassified Enterococcus]|uniref:efflux RND transporter periplasmic adaptor subunit n=1 Tax=unclassified Enterococcus TaxID=2608891 RepID=UPI001554F19C|nr:MULTISPECIES: HlyD family efflux transporter periplasmic adaptor subunit [unclassified Enterococcus]MBS7576875.1 efflux RND transporter periplasmic adaptor subunit [Enterococcus sp. MMGLQ5-2]MBS7584282.1 efflux RND transporter periplasmic adaptor subunit [Enterococcus sp. MMGLQ5-1]NPD12138.1 efflux RND transporter periplasmic adaptor subunit [Enterococcus sp. MMGLQ5-1]NPD36710.1 efflux RND transporter periplasmic adaptor subunit [Enterococcus sp. MMGLQ5-2]
MKKIKMNKKQRIRFSLIAAALVLVILAIAIFLSTRKKDEQVDTYHVMEIKLADPLIFKGITQAEKTQNYYLDSSLGRVSSISVTDGQAVQANTVLYSYENDTVQDQADEQSQSLSKLGLAVQNAQATLNAAVARQAEITNQVNQAKADYNASSDEAERESLNAKIDSLNASLDSQKDAVLQARQALDGANIDLASTNESIERIKEKITTTVTSGIDGIAYVNEKGKTDATSPIVTVVSPSTVVEGTVSEFDYERVKQDQKVTLKPTNGDQEVTGTITQVNQLPAQAAATDQASSTASSTSNYQFSVKPDSNIQYGYTVQINLPSNEIQLGKDNIIKEKEQYYVYLYQSGKAKKQAVKLQEKNGVYTVLEGLKVKDKIIEKPDDTLKDGQEVAVS